MISWLKHYKEIHDLRRDRNQIFHEADAKLKQRLMDGVDPQTAHNDHASELVEAAFISEQIAFSQSQRLRSQAYSLEIMMPDGEQWYEGHFMPRHLNFEGRAKLRAEIRTERKDRHELLFRWITAITGVLGTLIGLVAILKH